MRVAGKGMRLQDIGVVVERRSGVAGVSAYPDGIEGEGSGRLMVGAGDPSAASRSIGLRPEHCTSDHP
jgi:hypothetical protein